MSGLHRKDNIYIPEIFPEGPQPGRDAYGRPLTEDAFCKTRNFELKTATVTENCD
jgi:hypothetical protein